jgi:DNA polymerase-3 subunit beta
MGLEADTLGQMIAQVAFAAAADESRPILTGVLMRFAQEGPTEQLTMAAADGFRLSVRREALHHESSGEGPGDGIQDVIVPARALAELARISRASEARGGGADGGGPEEPIVLSITSERNQILFHQANVDLVSQLIEGHFPDYTQIIPTTYALRTVVDAGDLLKAVRMANIFARDAANIVRLTVVPGSELAPGHISVTATSAELGDHVGEIDASVEQAPGHEEESPTIAFNANYLIDALSCIDEQRVALETTTPSSPAVIKPVEGPDLTHVIMPIQISS